MQQAMYHFLLVVCSNNVSIWHRFRDITTFTVYATACDIEKSFTFDKKVAIISHAPRRASSVKRPTLAPPPRYSVMRIRAVWEVTWRGHAYFRHDLLSVGWACYVQPTYQIWNVYTLWFTCKHIVVITRYISGDTGVWKVSNSKMTFKVTEGHWY